MRKTKIVAPLGPASWDLPTIEKLTEVGVNVFRLNLSHGTHEDHFQALKNIGKGKNSVAVMLDTMGPEIRTGLMEKEVTLDRGQKFLLTTREVIGDKDRVTVSHRELPLEVEPGVRILLSDGLIELEVLEVQGENIKCLVLNGGTLNSRKGVNVPGVKSNLPSLTEKDRKDIEFGIANDVDFIAASFIRRAQDVLAIRKILEENVSEAQIIAKIENQSGVENIDEILEVADGIMVARGDMGVELPAEKVPMIQKQIIQKCNRAGKPVITATQMLESMINNPRPTRAEASDVANAILDGTDATMLSAETAAGKYPVESVETMSRIARETESSLPYRYNILERDTVAAKKSVTDSISHATYSAAMNLGAAAIISSTRSGHTARMVSKYRPAAPIIGATPNRKVARQLMLSWGVYPIYVKSTENTDEMIEASVQGALEAGFIQSGDLVLITAGTPAGIQGSTNLLKVHTVGEIIGRGTGIGKEPVEGIIRIARSSKEALDKVEDGDILVAEETDKDFVPAMERAGAIITREGGITSHTAIVGLSLGIPVIVGVENALMLPDGEKATIDAVRGLIYRGKAKVL